MGGVETGVDGWTTKISRSPSSTKSSPLNLEPADIERLNIACNEQSKKQKLMKRTIRESNKALSTKSLGIKRVNQYVMLKTLGTGISSRVIQCMVPDMHND